MGVIVLIIIVNRNMFVRYIFFCVVGTLDVIINRKQRASRKGDKSGLRNKVAQTFQKKYALQQHCSCSLRFARKRYHMTKDCTSSGCLQLWMPDVLRKLHVLYGKNSRGCGGLWQ